MPTYNSSNPDSTNPVTDNPEVTDTGTDLVPADKTSIRKPKLLREVDKECFERYESDSTECMKVLGDWHKTWADDMNFALIKGKQWDPAEISERTKESSPRPTLEMNHVKANNAQIINKVRINPPGINVIPQHNDPSSKSLDTANAIEGLLRNIERNNGINAFVHAFSCAVNGGFGGYYITAEFESDDSFDKKLVYKKILDATTIRWDPSSVEPDNSDMKYAMIDEPMTKEAFKQAFPDIPENWYEDLRVSSGTPVNIAAWGEKEKPIITNYIYAETTPEKLYLLNVKDEHENYKTAWESDIKTDGITEEQYQLEDGKPIFRISARKKIYWKKIAGGYLLEESEWPGRNIPVYIVPGEDVQIQGKRQLISATADLKAAQKTINYGISNSIELLGLSVKGHWQYAEGTLGTQQAALYASSHLHNAPLPYSPGPTDSNTGKPYLPKPEYINPLNYNPALSEVIRFGIEELKAISGQYNPSLGNTEQELSGKALGYLKETGDVATAGFLSHAVRVYQRSMNDCLECLPYYYNKERQLEILGKDGTSNTVWINRTYTPKDHNRPVHYDFTKSTYKCVIEIGKGYTTQLQENAAWVDGQMKNNPALAQVIPDIAFKISGEASGADGDLLKEGVERIKRSLPPNLTAPQEEESEIPPQVQQQIQQFQQQAQEQLQSLQQQNQELATRNQELESKAAIENRRLDIDEYNAVTDRAKINHDMGVNAFKAVSEAEAEMERMQLEAISGHETEHIRASSTHATNMNGRVPIQPMPAPVPNQPLPNQPQATPQGV